MNQMDDDIAIVDAHHHYWDVSRNRHPWLCDDPPIPFRYGDYSSICRNFLPDDYRNLTMHHNVTANVTMEGEWDEAALVGESAWMSEIAATYASPQAHVARAILHRPDAAEIIAGHADYELVRGIRHKPTTGPAPDRIEKGAAGSMSDPNWRAGYQELARHGLHFELQVPWWHVDELLDLIAAFPETPVVINHAFMPVDRSPEALADWHASLVRAAGAPAVTLKISGIGIRGKRWALADQRPIIDGCIDAFSPERCMFASNFPVDSLCGSFVEIFDGFKAATDDLDPNQRRALFHDTANRVYKLGLKTIV